ncbi:hypothetical protein MTO96_023731 [Rhipicephalus appendiculatus]
MARRPSHACTFAVGDPVLVRNYRGSPRWVQGVIARQTGPVSYNVDVTTSRGFFRWRRHRNQLLPRETDIGFEIANRPDESAAQESLISQQTPKQQAVAAPAQSPPPCHTEEGRRYPQRKRQPPQRY